jgi:hypothetical protein
VTLDDALRAAAGSGKFQHLTINYDPTQGKWQGNYREKGAIGYRVEYRDDPIAALVAALGMEQTTTPDADEDLIG